MIPLLSEAAPILRAQHSLITRRQAIHLTNSEATLRHLVRAGVWERVDCGLYGPSGVPMTWRRRLMAATLVAPRGSLISHRAAAALQGVGGLDEPTPELSIPRGYSLRRNWLIVHESSDLGLADLITVDHIAATGPLRLAMDLGGVVSFPRFKHTIRELRHDHRVDERALLRTYLRHKRQGRTGGGALRDWLDRYFEVQGISESGAELAVLDAIIDYGLPTPVRQRWVEIAGHRYRLDLAYPHHLTCLEVDGIQHEDDTDIADNDTKRESRLRLAGWRVLRIRARHLATDLPPVLRDLAAIVATP